MTISQIITAITSGTKTAEEITRYYLAQIAQKNPQINAFVEVFEQDALAQAKAVDAKKARGEKLGMLAGVPVGIKDNILYQGHKATCCSRMLGGWCTTRRTLPVYRVVLRVVRPPR